MTAPVERSTRMIASLLVGAAFLVLVLTGVAIARSNDTPSAAAEDKAAQFAAALGAAGLPVPTKEGIVRVLGEDGGALCVDPAGALQRAMFNSQLSNGAAGPGIRPVIAAERLAAGAKIAISVYCPDQLADFSQYVDDLKYAAVT